MTPSRKSERDGGEGGKERAHDQTAALASEEGLAHQLLGGTAANQPTA